MIITKLGEPSSSLGCWELWKQSLRVGAQVTLVAGGTVAVRITTGAVSKGIQRLQEINRLHNKANLVVSIGNPHLQQVELCLSVELSLVPGSPAVPLGQGHTVLLKFSWLSVANCLINAKN